jgi:hypothetical protein
MPSDNCDSEKILFALTSLALFRTGDVSVIRAGGGLGESVMGATSRDASDRSGWPAQPVHSRRLHDVSFARKPRNARPRIDSSHLRV